MSGPDDLPDDLWAAVSDVAEAARQHAEAVEAAERAASQLWDKLQAAADEAYLTGELKVVRALLRGLYWQALALTAQEIAVAFHVKTAHVSVLAGKWPTGKQCRYCRAEIMASSRSERRMLQDDRFDREAGGKRTYGSGARGHWRYCDGCYARMRPSEVQTLAEQRAGILRSAGWCMWARMEQVATTRTAESDEAAGMMRRDAALAAAGLLEIP